jgi:uncharacterized membrane protein
MKRRRSLAPFAVLAITCAMAWLFKRHCGDGWTGSIQYLTGCYSDVVPFWGLRGVAAGEVPFLQARLEYPVLTGALIWIDGVIARTTGGPGATAVNLLDAVALTNALLAGCVLAAMRRMGVGEARQYAWAAAPAIVLYLGHNWDMLAIALAMAALCLASEDRLRAGVATASFGAAAKLFPVVMLPVLGLSALLRPATPPGRRLLDTGRLVAVSLLAWGAVNLPIALLAPDNWLEFYRFSSERSGTAGATWDVLSHAGVWISAVPERNAASAITFMAGAAAILALGWRRQGGATWALFTPVLAWFMLTSKVWSPQFDLWLMPFLLVTCASPVAIALFAAADVAAYFAEFWMFAAMDGVPTGADQGTVGWAWAVRAVAMLWVIGEAVQGRRARLGDPRGPAHAKEEGPC